LCEVMEIHPMTLLALAYGGDAKGVDLLVERVRREIAELQAASNTV